MSRHSITLDQESFHLWSRFALRCPNRKHDDAPIVVSASGQQWDKVRAMFDESAGDISICPASLLCVASLSNRLECNSSSVSLGEHAKEKPRDRDDPAPCECMQQGTRRTQITWGSKSTVCAIVTALSEQGLTGETVIKIQDEFGRHRTPQEWLKSLRETN